MNESNRARPTRVKIPSEDEFARSRKLAREKFGDLGQGKGKKDNYYKFWRAVQAEKCRKYIPEWLQEIAYQKANKLYQENLVNVYQHFHPDDPMSSFAVPEEEEVELPVIWVVELFPPSYAAVLRESMAKNRWEQVDWSSHFGESRTEQLDESRAGAGFDWWVIARLDASARSRNLLPSEIERVEILAYQIGTGHTAIVCRFDIASDRSELLNTIWKSDHAPHLGDRGGRAVALDRRWAGYEKTQEARVVIHNVAREWMGKFFPGFFAANKIDPPLLDLITFKTWDLAANTSEDEQGQRGAVRALGITGLTPKVLSPHLPGFLLNKNDVRLTSTIGSERVRTLCASRETLRIDKQSLQFYGMSEGGRGKGHAIGGYISELVEPWFVSQALLDMLECYEKQYSGLRDQMQMRYAKFDHRGIKALRNQLVSTSHDLAMVDIDLRPSTRNSRIKNALKFIAVYPPHDIEENAEGDFDSGSADEIDVSEIWEKRKQTLVERLLTTDQIYRDVLTATTSLDSTIENTRTGRSALGVSALSLIVAVVALSLTKFEEPNLLSSVGQTFETIIEGIRSFIDADSVAEKPADT